MPRNEEIPGSPLEWLAKAKEDLVLAGIPLPEGASYEPLCFHAQQADVPSASVERPMRRAPSIQCSPILRVDMGLVENASQRADRDLVLPRHDRCIYRLSRTSNELHVAALLSGLHEAKRFQPPLDLAEGLRLKPSQPRPRSSAALEVEWPGAARSGAPAPLSGWRAPPPASRLGWRYRFRDIGKRTSFPRATPARKTTASSTRFCHTHRASPTARQDSTFS